MEFSRKLESSEDWAQTWKPVILSAFDLRNWAGFVNRPLEETSLKVAKPHKSKKTFICRSVTELSRNSGANHPTTAVKVKPFFGMYHVCTCSVYVHMN
jgi:hypothetical protein